MDVVIYIQHMLRVNFSVFIFRLKRYFLSIHFKVDQFFSCVCFCFLSFPVFVSVSVMLDTGTLLHLRTLTSVQKGRL